MNLRSILLQVYFLVNKAIDAVVCMGVDGKWLIMLFMVKNLNYCVHLLRLTKNGGMLYANRHLALFLRLWLF